MKEILYLKLNHLKRGAHFSFAKFLLNLFAIYVAVGEEFSAIVARLRAAFEEEDRILLRHKGSFLTPELLELDKARDKAYSVVRNTLRAFCDLPYADKSAAAKFLYKVVKDYGYLPDKQYDDETGLMDNLCQDLQQKYPEQVELLGIGDLVTKMAAANDEFRTKLFERTEEDGEKMPGDLQKARRQFDEAYRVFRNLFNAMLEATPDMGHQEFLRTLNAEIRRLRIVIGQNATTGSGELVEEEEEEEEEVEEEVTPTPPAEETPGDKPDETPGDKPETPGNNENQTPDEDNKPGSQPSEGGDNGNGNGNTGDENTGGTPPEEDDPNMPPPGSGGSGFE